MTSEMGDLDRVWCMLIALCLQSGQESEQVEGAEKIKSAAH